MDVQQKSNESLDGNLTKVQRTEVECRCNNGGATMRMPLQLTALQRWRVARNGQCDVRGHNVIKRSWIPRWWATVTWRCNVAICDSASAITRSVIKVVACNIASLHCNSASRCDGVATHFVVALELASQQHYNLHCDNTTTCVAAVL
jgi:hypothetical protein